METSEIKNRIERVIRYGVDQEYLSIVKDLEDSYYLEDVAAAAIEIFAEQGSQQGVRRRSLHHAPVLSPGTPEERATRKKMPVQHSAKLAAMRKNVHSEHRDLKSVGAYGGRRVHNELGKHLRKRK